MLQESGAGGEEGGGQPAAWHSVAEQAANFLGSRGAQQDATAGKKHAPLQPTVSQVGSPCVHAMLAFGNAIFQPRSAATSADMHITAVRTGAHCGHPA